MGLQSDKRGMEELRSAMEDLARGTTAPSSSSLEPEAKVKVKQKIHKAPAASELGWR